MCKLNLRQWVKIGTDRVKERRGDSEGERCIGERERKSERGEEETERERCNPASCTLYDWSDHTRWTPNYLLFLSQHLCRSNKSSYHFISPLPFGLFQFVVSSFQAMNICLQLCVLFLRLLFYLTLCFFYRFVFLLWRARGPGSTFYRSDHRYERAEGPREVSASLPTRTRQQISAVYFLPVLRGFRRASVEQAQTKLKQKKGRSERIR